MQKCLELNRPVFRIAREKVIYLVFIIDLGSTLCTWCELPVHLVHFGFRFIEERNDASAISRATLAEPKQEILVSHDETICLFKPYIHTDDVCVEISDVFAFIRLEKYNTGHAQNYG
jgi:hypothetical protein